MRTQPDPLPPNRFRLDSYVRLPGLLVGPALGRLRADAAALESAATRRDFTMACMNDSPRHMTTVGGQAISQRSTSIPQCYARLIPDMRELTGLDLIEVPDPVERHVLNVLHQPGDTHGAHVDDYPVALVLFLETPPSPGDGGLLEYVPGTAELNQLNTHRVQRAYHRAGDAYVLRSDTTAHRVTPLRRAGVRRVALNFAYATPETADGRTPSAAQLYS